MIVLCVSDAHYIVSRKPHLLQRAFEAAGLVDAGRQHHDGPLVEDDLQLQAQLVDRLEDRLLVWLPCRDDNAAHRHRAHPLVTQGGYEGLGRPIGQGRLGAGRRVVEQGTVLGDDIFEQIEPRADALQVIELAPGDQHEASAGGNQALESVHSFGQHATRSRECAVIVAAECLVVHPESF